MKNISGPVESSTRKGFVVLFALISLNIVVFGQLDSLQQDSLDKVVLAEERAALIPAEYAALIIDVNDEYYPQLSGARSLVFNSGINKLRRQHEELDRLTDYVLLRNNVLESIQSLEEKWRAQIDDVTAFTDDIESRTTEIIELKKVLTERRAGWLDSQTKLEYGEHPPKILEYVSVSTDTIDYFLDQGATIIDTFTVMYSSVVDLLLDGRERADRLKEMRQSRLASLMTERRPLIWQIGFGYDVNSIKSNIDYLRDAGRTDAQYYLREHKWGIINSCLLFVFFIFTFYWTRSRSLKLHDDEEPELVRNIHILEQPFTMALFAWLVSLSLMLPNLPPLVSYASALLLVYCVVSILTKIMKGKARWMGYTLAGLLFILQFNEFLSGGEGQLRWLTLVISMVITAMMVWVRRNKNYLSSGSQKGHWSALIIPISPVIAIVSLAAIVMNIVGFSRIAQLMNSGSILTLNLGLLLLSMFRSLMSVVYHFFHTAFANNSMIIKQDGDSIFQGMTRLLRIFLMGVYIYFCLNFFLIWEPISDFLLSIWELGYEFGKVKLTVGNIIHVFLTILAFYIVASIISIILRKEVFHRVDLPRGVGNAVASVTQYTVVVVGVFLALASAGFETQHLSILVGGLGIGIGFGLQSIFNNFLSGLILVFERPVTVDDVVEVDGMLGVVTSIGIRASKIRQYNGDEVIVPNSDLIAKQVINRTLSDKRRRYTMEFETGRKVQPDKVVEIIAAAAAGVEGVLDDPPAKAYFKGMEQQSNFYYVHYWGEDNFLDLMSDVEVAVYKAFGKEGVDMPIPIAVELDEVPKEIID